MAIKFLNTATAATQAAGDNSTKIATTAYADAAASAIPIGNYLPLAGGTMTGQITATPGIEMGAGNINFADSGKVRLGNSSDLQIYHDGTHSHIINTTGDLTIDSQGDDLLLKAADDLLLYVQGTEVALQAIGNAGVKIRYNNVVKFETTNTGVSVAGQGIFTGNVGIGTTSPSQKLHVAGNMRLQNQFYDSTNSTGSNGQVLTKTSAGTIWADNRGLTPTTPGGIVATIVGQTIEIAFNQSTTSNIDYYQVWSSDDAGDYGIIGQIAPADFSSTMTVVDTTFVTGGTMSYRVYAVKSGVYSTAGTVSKAYTVSALSVTDMTVVNLNTAYYIQYEKPLSRFIDHVEIYMDSQTTSAALNRSNASIVYSGQNASYMRNVNTSSNFHQFWVEIVTS